jgi:UDP-3-O-[3-hydroxymyristoyl] glucosamine N-acyltransferase
MTARKPSTVAEIAQLVGAELVGDGRRAIRGPASLQEAGPDEISFLANPRYAPQLATTRAAAVVVSRGEASAREGLALLRVDDPNRAFTRIVEAFAAPSTARSPGIHPTATVHAGARVAPGASIGAGCVVEDGADIADGVVLDALVYVGRGARIGAGTRAHPGVVIGDDVRVGARCILHAGCVLGSDGYGFEPAPDFKRDGWLKIPQCGTVVVEDDVEIGANTTIDRARFGATRIGAGAKLDNLVHVAHNVVVEPRVLLVAQVGIAGSSRIGAASILAGQVGIAGHVTLAPGVRVGAQSGVNHDLAPGDYFGSPARPLRESARDQSPGKRIQALRERVAALEAKVAALTRGETGS